MQQSNIIPFPQRGWLTPATRRATKTAVAFVKKTFVGKATKRLPSPAQMEAKRQELANKYAKKGKAHG